VKKERKSIPRHGKQEEGLGYPFRMVFVDVLTLALVLVGFHVFRVGHIPGYWPLEVYLVSLFFSFLALFISGGYGEKSDKLSLEYATVHLSSFLMAFPLLMTSVYAFTAYSESMRPARAVVIPTVFSFALLSLGIRRLTHLKMMRNKGQGYFSVLGRTDDLWAIWNELM